MRRLYLTSFAIFALLGCAGEDYTPVYFPGTSAQETQEGTPSGSDFNLTKAQCDLELSAKLCVKIKGENIEVGTDENDPLCTDTPPIPLKIEGEKIFLKGSEFPGISIAVDVRGVATPMTINGKGDTDGSQNVGEGSWTPDGDILIQDFSFFINVLGMSGEIPNIDLTTDEAKSVPDLAPLQGEAAEASGNITLVAATELGPLFAAADEYLLGASLQATFTGTLTPPLSECAADTEAIETLRIVKLRPQREGRFTEEPLPEGNILEISKGTFIAQGPQDVGENFEAKAHFKAVNEGEQAVEVKFPNSIGPFYFLVSGQMRQNLAPNKSILFQILFRPDTSNVSEPGPVKESFTLGSKRLQLVGVALSPEGRASVEQTDASGDVSLSNVEQVSFAIVSLPTTPARAYFQCQATSCEGQEAITACQPCGDITTPQCRLAIINTDSRPLEEVNEECQPLDPDSAPRMQINLTSNGERTSSQQLLTIENQGVEKLEIVAVRIEEVENSQSRGEFLIAEPQELPISLPPASAQTSAQKIFIAVTYLPKDLIGFDGRLASPGQPVIDKAYLALETTAEPKRILLTGRTQVQDVPNLQAYFATPTGLKAKSGRETFTFEEVTAQTQDLAYPVFLHVSESALKGIRITEIKIMGEDARYFEWLDSQAEVNQRQPAAGSGRRCSIPVFDSQTGRMIDEQFDLHFVSMGSQGFDLKPGAFTLNNLPLFGCVNFHRDPNQSVTQRIFTADLSVTGFELDAQGRLARTADNNFRQTSMTIHLVAAIDPLKGKMVARITQTTFALLNAQNPNISGMPALQEIARMREEGGESEAAVLFGAIILDPFDEMEITDARGEVVSVPGDGITAVTRQIDTRPSALNYQEENLFDHTTLLDDIFYDYDFPDHPLPDPLHVNGWRIFTGALSYPGPLSPRSPIRRSECEVIDPCDSEDLRQFSESGIGSDGKGACAFFFASTGRYHSGAFEPAIQGEEHNLCDVREQPQDLIALNSGHYSVDGSLTFEDLGLRFWGPTYIHNPYGPLGDLPPLDEIFHIAFTTEVLKPAQGSDEWNVLPDEKIDFGKQDHKLNLTDPDLATPRICPENTANRTIGARTYSSWRYFAPLIFKDELGEIPAGCPEPSQPFSGGTAFLKGRRIDPETKIFTIVTAAKFGSREELSLAFKNIMIFAALNGWVCDPQGSEEDFEGAKCFDPTLNERDAKAQISIMGDNL